MTVTTIDCTPAGMQTPTGIARVNEALRIKDDASACIVQEAAYLWENRNAYAENGPNGEVIPANRLDYLGECIARYNAAHEQFLRAVAGR